MDDDICNSKEWIDLSLLLLDSFEHFLERPLIDRGGGTCTAGDAALSIAKCRGCPWNAAGSNSLLRQPICAQAVGNGFGYDSCDAFAEDCGAY